MLQTLERNVHTFDAQVLTPAGAAALAELTGPAGLPFLPPDRQRTALENGQIIADYAGQPELQAAAALMPLYDDACSRVSNVSSSPCSPKSSTARARC